jgi:glucose/arabinose dehydrogenase
MRHRLRPRSPWAVLLLGVLLAGCGAGARAQEPDWKPAPSFQGEGQLPSITVPGPPADTPQRGPYGGSSDTPNPSGSDGADPAVVATKLDSPVGLVVLPDGTALVGERTTGRVVRVQPRPDQPVQTVRTLVGVNPTGDGGLLDLALSPHYRQDSLIFAYLTTASDNRVVAFTLTGPVTPVLTGIPNGPSDNTGRIAFGPDGNLFIGTGDAGNPALAADPMSLAGKVLRVDDIGSPAPGNPSPGSPVFTSGHRVVDGLCLDPKSGTLLEVEAGADTDKVNLLRAGASYGWPSAGAGVHPPLTTLPKADRGPGGCAVQGGVLYVTSLDGQALLASSILARAGSVSIDPFTLLLEKKYGRLRTVVPAPDGTLWLTTSNRDGHGSPVRDDDRVLRITPGGASAIYPG